MASQAKQTSRLYCNHCKLPAGKRSDLDAHLLCATCRVVPGVRGWRDPKTRGIESGSPAYLKQNPIRNIITDDITDDAPPTSTIVSAGVRTWTEDADGNVIPTTPERPGGTLQGWREAVFASKVCDRVKVLLLKLADCADYDTEPTPGGNCFPSLRKLAEALGWSVTRVRRTITEARYEWLLVCEVEVAVGDGIERTSNQYLLCWPDGRRLSMADNKRAR